MKTKTLLIALISLLIINEAAFARAGGRSSGFGGSRSSGYSNQGSRGSRTYDGGSANGKSYSAMEKSTTAKNSSTANNGQTNNQGNNSQNQNQNYNQQNSQPSFFQRNPMLSTFGAAIAGSWIGNMLFGSSSGHAGNVAAGDNGAAGSAVDSATNSGGFFSGIAPIILIGLLGWLIFRAIKNRSNNQNNVDQGNFSNNDQNSIPLSQDISLPEFEKQKFSQILIEVQSSWSDQDMDRLKNSVTPEILKYFSNALHQNQSQNLQNKVENIKVMSITISEAWQEEDLQFATAILEWSALDYNMTIDTKRIIDQEDASVAQNSSEAWTFVRYKADGKWLLSAIAQIY